MSVRNRNVRKEIGTVDATPTKRIFYSIIADYDLNRSICELVDNGLDVWVRGKKAKAITINIVLNQAQQTITVEDNAGGLPKDDLRFIVGPGVTGTAPTDQTIGIFGVGTKRAVVALAQDIRITTRFAGDKTYQIAFDDAWIEDDSWWLPLVEVDSIPEGKTVVQLQRLRAEITPETIALLKDHLRATYAKFISNSDVTINLNGDTLTAHYFKNWAYPPKYEPRKYTGMLEGENGNIEVEAVAGLSRESSPATGEYGVYFYCNDRLIVRGLKTFEVGFTKGFAGQPHPKVSLTRVIVSLKGDARDMPWNSSKSDISTKHPVFLALHDFLLQVVKDYATLSRNWMGEWPSKVFKFKQGSIIHVAVANFPVVKKSYLPPPPKMRPRYAEVIAQKNREIGKRKPWAKGLYEGVIAADSVFKDNRLEQKKRIAIIILDSTLEIAFKEYLVNDSGTYYSDAQLLAVFKTRQTVKLEIQKYVRIGADNWKKIGFYNGLRNKLVHERGTVGLSDGQIEDYREIVEGILKKLFKLRFDGN
jgi:hypothetical protein